MSVRPPARPRLLAARLSRLSPAVTIAALALVLPAPASGAETPPSGALYRDGPSGRYLLDGAWYRRADPADTGVHAGWEHARSPAGWLATGIPNAANAGDFSEQSYLGTVWWYRKDFRVPRAPPGSHWILRFESVNYRATVWLNGRMLGSHTGAYLPFELGARGVRHGLNRLVVRVDSRRRPFDVPSLSVRQDGRFVGGWWNYAGILREVYLRRVRKLDLADVLVRPRLPCYRCPATVTIDATVANIGGKETLAALSGRVGRENYLRFRPAAIPAGGTRHLRARLRLDEPRLWSPQHPSLYKVTLGVHDEQGETVQRYTVHTGIRNFKISRTGRLLINYHPATLRGASLHEDDAVAGAALTPDAIRQNVGLLRQLGATMTRAHYPLHPLTLELADRYGILVWSEIPVYQMQDSLFRNDGVRKQSLSMLRQLIYRDRNHPSVLVWSVGNENTSRPGVGFQRYVLEAKRLARRLDPTRLVGLAFPGYPTIERQSLYARLDALGVNDYFGWYPGPGNSIARREDLGPYLDRLHARYPRQALFVTEFGAEANHSGQADEKGTFEFQRDFLVYHLLTFGARPFINGALVWILRDFRVKPLYDGGNPNPDPPNNRKGLVDFAGVKKPAFDAVQNLFGGPRKDG